MRREGVDLSMWAVSLSKRRVRRGSARHASSSFYPPPLSPPLSSRVDKPPVLLIRPRGSSVVSPALRYPLYCRMIYRGNIEKWPSTLLLSRRWRQIRRYIMYYSLSLSQIVRIAGAFRERITKSGVPASRSSDGTKRGERLKSDRLKLRDGGCRRWRN